MWRGLRPGFWRLHTAGLVPGPGEDRTGQEPERPWPPPHRPRGPVPPPGPSLTAGLSSRWPLMCLDAGGGCVTPGNSQQEGLTRGSVLEQCCAPPTHGGQGPCLDWICLSRGALSLQPSVYELVRAPGFAQLPLIVEDFVKDAGASFSGELGGAAGDGWDTLARPASWG